MKAFLNEASDELIESNAEDVRRSLTYPTAVRRFLADGK
jgi:hypothetical protein